MSTFKDWTPQTAEEHNRRVAAAAVASMGFARAEKLSDGLNRESIEKRETHEASFKQLSTNLVVAHSTDVKKLNKLEKAWLRHLEMLGFPWIGVQAITLKLADDTRYTPDFMVIDANGQLVAYETKGWMRDDAAVKLKVAARLYRFIRFVLVQKDKGQWKETPVNP